ncbi:MAG: PEP-CTERM sorting domain-containing protein [Aquisalimonadaceae bacterium]
MKGLQNLAVAAALMLGTGALQATPITIDLDFTGFADGYRTGTISSNGHNQNVAAGMFSFDTSNAQGDSPLDWTGTLEAFCVQIDTMLQQSATTTYNLMTADNYFDNAGMVDQIGRLYTGFHTAVSGGLASAAFQLALWEIVNESTASLDLTSGNFVTTGFNGARTTADAWLDGLADIDNAFTMYVLATDPTDRSQDLLVFTPKPPISVPEPGTLGLLGLGLAAMAWRRRRV